MKKIVPVPVTSQTSKNICGLERAQLKPGRLHNQQNPAQPVNYTTGDCSHTHHPRLVLCFLRLLQR